VTQLEFIGHLDAMEVAPDVVIVSARGPIDGRVAAELRELLLPVAAGEGIVVQLDLSEAHGLDAETLSVVAQAAHLAACRGERLALITHSRSLVAELTESGLADLISIKKSLEDVIFNG
jgi:anti-anti-sigma factor